MKGKVNLSFEQSEQSPQRVVITVGYTLFQGYDRIVGDRDVFRADVGAALGDIAKANTVAMLQVTHAILHIEGVHLQRRRIDHVARACESFVQVMLAQHVAYILTKEALDALPEFLHAIDVALIDPPCPIRSIRRPGPELLDLLFHPIVY